MQEQRSDKIDIRGVELTERDARELLNMFKSPAYRNSYSKLLNNGKVAESESQMIPGTTNDMLRESVGGMKVYSGLMGVPDGLEQAIDEFDSLRQD